MPSYRTALLCIACNLVSVGSLRVALHGAVAHGQPARHTLRSGGAYCCADGSVGVPAACKFMADPTLKGMSVEDKSAFLASKGVDAFVIAQATCVTNEDNVQGHPELPGAAAPVVLELDDDTSGPDDISNANILRIVLSETTDEETNALVWKYLGYRYDAAAGEYDASAVFPKWAKKYPQPPDLIGVTRTYERAVDEPVLRAVQALQKSVPTEHKDNLRQCLKPLGWPGFKMEGLTPNMTRRAQVGQWLIYYRKALHGVSLEELVRRREARQLEEAAKVAADGTLPPTGTTKQGVL